MSPRGIVRDADGTLLIADAGDPWTGAPDGAIVRLDPVDWSQVLVASGGHLINPNGMAFLEATELVVAEPYGARLIRVELATGAQWVISEGNLLQEPRDVAVDVDRSLLVADASAAVLRVLPDTGTQIPITIGGLLDQPSGIAVEPSGSLIVADEWAGLVRVDPATGAQTLLAPTSWPEMAAPADVQVGENGHLWIADPHAFELGAILEIDPTSGAILTAFYGGSGATFEQPRGLALTPVISNTATVTAETPDPDSKNNHSTAFTELVESTGGTVVLEITETVGVSDSISMQAAVLLLVSESVVVSDLVATLPAVLIDVAEQIAISDAVDTLPVITISVVEAVGIQDLVNTQHSVRLSVNEAIAVQDAVEGLPSLLLSIAESVTVNDAATVLPPIVLAVSESVSVSDAVVALPAVMISLAEAVSVTDAISLLPAVLLAVQESVSVSDAVGANPAVLLFVQDSLSVSDQVELTFVGLGPPTVLGVNTVAATREGRLDPDEATTSSITQFLVAFSEPVSDPPGNTDPDDVTNPANFLLLADGGDGVFQTTSCASGVDPADVQVPVGPVIYVDPERTAAVALVDEKALPRGDYRLLVCGSTSIVDLTGDPLDGDGDGTGGDDHLLPFQVLVSNALDNPNLDHDLAGWQAIHPAGAQIEQVLEDVDAAPSSGSVRAANLGAAGDLVLRQCVAAEEGAWYRVRARLRMDSELPETPEGWLAVQWFSEPECGGPILGEALAPLGTGSTDGLWLTFDRAERSALETLSASLTLGISAAEGEAFEARLDDLVLGLDPDLLFEDGFESGDLSSWQSRP